VPKTTKPTITAPIDFIGKLFEWTDAPIYFSSLANNRDDADEPGERHVSTRDIVALNQFIAKWDRPKRGLFFSVGILKAHARRFKASVVQTSFLHADVDFKNVDGGEAAAREALKLLRLQPTFIVASGNGLHLYWMLREPIDTQPEIDRIEALLRQLADHVAGDLQVCEVSRLMRLPGTHNTKDDAWKPVTVERASSVAFEIDELEEWMSETAPLLRRKSVAGKEPAAQHLGPGDVFINAAKLQGFKPPVDVEARLRAMTYGGPEDSSIHATQLSVSASLLNAGRPLDEVVGLLLEATRAAAGDLGRHWNWTREEWTIRKLCQTWVGKHPQEPQQTQQCLLDDSLNVTAIKGGKNRVKTPPHSQGAQIVSAVAVDEARAKRKAKPSGKDGVPDHIDVGRTVLESLRQRDMGVLFTPKGAYRYEDGLWHLETDIGMRAWLDAQIEACVRALPVKSANRLVNEARAWVIRNPDLHKDFVDWDGHGQIPTMSGLVHPQTGKLTPATPGHWVTWRVPFQYWPEAGCRYWLEMLDSMLADREPDVRAQYVGMIQEILGAALIDRKGKGLSKALVAWGPQDTGKSGLMDVMGGLFGPDVNTTPLAVLDANHSTMGFLDRRPWVLHEAFEQSVWHLSSVVKSIISGDAININVKNGPYLSRRVSAPVFWATNHAPQFREATRAIVERMIIVPCRQTFSQAVPTGAAIEARRLGYASPAELVLATEMAGVLAWAVEGLRRCLPRGHFIVPVDAQEASNEVRLDSNIVAGFVEDCVDFSPDGMVSTADFSAAFVSWWLEHKGEERGAPSGDRIAKALRALGDQRIATDRVELRDMHRRYYAGLKLNPEGMRHWKNTVTNEAFAFQGRKASTSSVDEGPNTYVPSTWDEKPAVVVMRRAHKNSMTASMTTSVTGHAAAVIGMTADDDDDERSSSGHRAGHVGQPIGEPRKPRF